MHIRIRDVSIKANFPTAFSDKVCSASELCYFEETQKHVYSCEFLSPKNQISDKNIKFEQIFGNSTAEQDIIAEIFFQRFKRLKECVTSRNKSAERPGDPRIRLGIR